MKPLFMIKPISIIPESNLRQTILLLFFALIMLIVRIVLPHALVFTNWPGPEGNFVNFAADDAVYQMRLVHNTLQHFPYRIFFDPFTYFPYGSQIHFGPFFTLIIASIALLIGFGHPSAHLVNVIGAYTPPIMGALCLIPLYFFTRKVFNKTAAIFATFVLALLPGEFLQRSALGFTDNHVAEVLFSTTICAFFAYFLTAIKDCNLASKNWKTLLTSWPLLFSYSAGFFFGIFLLTWTPALLFGAIFLAYFIVQLLINYWRNQGQNTVLYFAIPFYSIPILMLLPYALNNPHFSLMYYSLSQPIILLLMIVSLLCSIGIAKLLKATDTRPIFLPLTLLILVFFITAIIQYIAPPIYQLIHDGINLLFNVTGSFKTITELRSGIMDMTGKFSIQPIWQNLFWATGFAGLGFIILSYRICRYKNPSEIFLAIWTLVILAATCSELRFIYYLAINAAVLSGYCAYIVFNFLLQFNPQKKLVLYSQKIAVVGFAIFFTGVISAPLFALLLDKKIQSGPHVTREWYDTLMWLRTNTPDPQGHPIAHNFNYTQGLYSIPEQSHYSYPKSAYGILSWWDFGHQITYIAHRIPNANPFQEGVIGENQTGVAPFLTASSEETALKNLNVMGTRYIMINSEMATSFFGNISLWVNDTKGWVSAAKFKNLAPTTENKLFAIDSSKFINSMTSRLYYYDCNALSHFRLVHESNGKYAVLSRTLDIKHPAFNPTQFSAFVIEDYAKALDLYKRAEKTYWLNKENTILVYAPRPPVKNIKIFEKVKGAIIAGYAPSGKTIRATLLLKTKYGRTFTYTQSTTAVNNQFQITVPYATEPMQGDGYKYDITPLGQYLLNIDGKSLNVNIPEKAVMEGETIRI